MPLPRLTLPLLLLCALLLAPAGARAATLTVTDPGDTGGPSQLRAAIATANTDGGDDTITFAVTGTITLTAANGPLAVTAPMTIQGPGAGSLAIDGGYTGNRDGVGVFTLSGGTSTAPVALSGLTIQHGDAGAGGGVGVISGSASLTDCVLTGNVAILGGCVANLGGSVSLTRCTLADSTGTEYGGGLYNGGGTTLGTATLTGCTFTKNVSTYGGGLYNDGPNTEGNTVYLGGAVTATGCTFSGDMCAGGFASDSGGGLYNHGQATLTGCAIVGNSGQATLFGGPDEGDGLYNDGQATLTDCAIAGNSSQSGDGGGLDNAGTVTLVNCSLTGNSTQTDFAVVGGRPLGGGGVVNSGTATLTGCTLAGNSAILKGGGLLNSGGTATLTGCTLAGNSADTLEPPMFRGYGGGGAVYVGGGAVNLTDDILYGDSSLIGAEVQGVVAASHCDIQQSGFGQPGSPATPDASGSFDADPLFVGGGDLHLDPGSPCAGAGTASAPGNSYLPYDLDGRPRPTPPYTAPSIGAYEAAPSGAYSLVVENTSDSLPRSLRTAVQCADDYPDAAVTFDPQVFTAFQTITLTSGQLALSVPLTITGPAPGVAVSGNKTSRVFEISGGTSSQPVTLSGLTIENGKVGNANGGGVLVNGGAVTLTGCALTGNSTASIQGGGGLANNGNAAVTLTACTISGNSSGLGGGLYNAEAGTLTLTACALTQNSGRYGGGLYNNGGTATLTACALTGNSAGEGGGLYNFETAMLTGCTLTGNSAIFGGGLYNAGGRATLTDDILYGDAGGEVLDFATATATYSDIGGGYAGTDNVNVDPLFVGAPGDLHVQPGSPVVGAGIAATGNAHDITGQLRANPPTLGAYEGQKAQTRTSLASSLNPSAVGQTVTLTVTVADQSAPGGPVPTGTVTLSGLPAGAQTLALNASGQATYQTSALPAGTYTVTAVYTPAAHNFQGSASDILRQTVLAPPTASPQTVAVPFNRAVPVTLTGTDPNDPPQSLTFAVATPPQHGTLTGTAPRLTYTPTAGYHGADSFTFTVSNGPATSPAATVTLNVAAGVPTADPQSVTTDENAAVAVTLTGSDPDVPPLGLTYALASSPPHGTLSGFNAATGAVTYTPNAGYSGPDAFTFTVSNGTHTSLLARVSLTVAAPVPATVTGVSATWGSRTAPLTAGASLLPLGRTTDVPWLGVKSFTVTLSAPETLGAGDVTVTGVTVAGYGPVTVTGSGTSYTVTLATPVSAADRVTLSIGNAGIAAFTGTLPVLPGDVTDDGTIGAPDLVADHAAFGTANAYADINGDGLVNITDYSLIRTKIGTQLP